MEHERDWDSSAFRTTENVYFRAWHGDQIEERVKQPRSKLLSEQETVKTEKHWKQSKTKWRFVHWLRTDWKDKRSENLHYRPIWENIIAMPQGKSDLPLVFASRIPIRLPGQLHPWLRPLRHFVLIWLSPCRCRLRNGEIKSISDFSTSLASWMNPFVWPLYWGRTKRNDNFYRRPCHMQSTFSCCLSGDKNNVDCRFRSQRIEPWIKMKQVWLIEMYQV